MLPQNYLGFEVCAALALEGKPLKYFEEMLEPLELETLREQDPEAFEEEKMEIDPAKVSDSFNISLQLVIVKLFQELVSEELPKTFQFCFKFPAECKPALVNLFVCSFVCSFFHLSVL